MFANGKRFVVEDVKRQVRRGASYIDIVAYTDGPPLVVEVKRQRVTQNAIRQVLAYADLLSGDVAGVPIVVGHGLADNLDLSDVAASVGTYGDDLCIRTARQGGCEITFQHVKSHSHPTEGKRTEQKRTELNRTEGSLGRF